MAVKRTDIRIGVRDETAQGIASIRQSIGSLKGVFAAAGIGISGAAFVGFQKSIADSIDRVGKLSLKLGIATEDLSEFRLVASQSGVGFEQFTTALQRAGRRIAEAAQGTGEAQAAIRELGLDAQALSRLSIDDQFRELSRAIAEVESPTDRLRLAFKLFDSEGAALLQTINSTGGEIDKLGREASRLGIIVSEDLAAEIQTMNDSIDLAQNAFRGLGISILDTLAPAVTGFANTVANAVVRLREFAEALGIIDKRATNFSLDTIGAEIDETGAKLAEVRQQIADIENQPAGRGRNAAGRSRALEGLRAEADEYAAYLDELQQRRDALLAGDGGAGGGDIPVARISRVRVESDGSEGEALANSIADDIEALQAAREERDRVIASILRDVGSPAEKFRVEFDQIVAQAEKYAIDAELVQRQISEAAIELLDAQEQTFEKIDEKGTETLESLRSELSRFTADLTDAFFDSSKSIQDIFKDLLGSIAKLLARKAIFDPLEKFLGGALDSVFGGARATGGPVAAGKAYLVGEKGPELFVPRASGGIVPNDKLGGGAPKITVNVQNNSGAQVTPDVSERDGETQIDIIVEGAVGRLSGRGALQPLGITPGLVAR